MELKILAISDEVSKALYEYFDPKKLEGIDMIVSCGDLPAYYLTFWATVFRGPVLYIHGNHDVKYAYKPPEGCICIEDTIYEYKGVRFLGLGGSYQYNSTEWQFTEKQMEKRVRKLWWMIRKYKGFDVLVTHAPAYRLSDGKDLCHRGFRAFRILMDKYAPKLYLYGHVHMSYGDFPRKFYYKHTLCVNAYGYNEVHLGA